MMMFSSMDQCQNVRMCVWMLLSHDVTMLQLVSSGLAQKRGSHYITKAQTHMFFYCVADERTQQRNKHFSCFFTL